MARVHPVYFAKAEQATGGGQPLDQANQPKPADVSKLAATVLLSSSS